MLPSVILPSCPCHPPLTVQMAVAALKNVIVTPVLLPQALPKADRPPFWQKYKFFSLTLLLSLQLNHNAFIVIE